MSSVPYAPSHHLEGDAQVVLDASAEMTGPRAPAVVGGGRRRRRARRWHIEGDALLVLAGDAEIYLLDLAAILADDAEVIELLMASSVSRAPAAAGWSRGELEVWRELVEEDDERLAAAERRALAGREPPIT